jgi:hypothetical protein
MVTGGNIMSKGKPRWYPDKPQNNMSIPCTRFEDHGNGNYYCEQGTSDDAKTCKGNPHNCVKTKYHRAASRSNKQIIDGV